MSAYMVDREHVTYLVDAAMSRAIVRNHHSISWYHDGQHYTLGCGDYARAAEVGQMLWDANKESVQARYPDTADETLVYDEHNPCFGHTFNPVEVIKAIRCFDYQACEYEGWKTSEARAFLEALKHHAIAALPGMEAAAWGAPKNYRVAPRPRVVRAVRRG